MTVGPSPVAATETAWQNQRRKRVEIVREMNESEDYQAFNTKTPRIPWIFIGTHDSGPIEGRTRRNDGNASFGNLKASIGSTT